MEPSLHRNRSPSQPAMPPFLPEQGVLAAMTWSEARPSTAAMIKHSEKDVLGSRADGLFIETTTRGRRLRPHDLSRPCIQREETNSMLQNCQ
jgi:hypothetical protein